MSPQSEVRRSQRSKETETKKIVDEAKNSDTSERERSQLQGISSEMRDKTIKKTSAKEKIWEAIREYEALLQEGYKEASTTLKEDMPDKRDKMEYFMRKLNKLRKDPIYKELKDMDS